MSKTKFQKFGESFKSATGVSLAALFIIWATNGTEAVQALAGVPMLIAAYADGLPFGFWSGVIGTVLGCCFHLFARSWHKRSFGIEVATIMVGLATVMAQMHGGSGPQVISAALVGLVAGFGGLFISKGIRAMIIRNDDEDANSVDPVSEND